VTSHTKGLFPVARTLSDDGPISLVYERDVPIPLSDGAILRANLYRPVDGQPAPVLMTFGHYGKDTPLTFRNVEHFHAAGAGVFLNWETPDPEHWVPRGYAVLRVDSRGAGASPGQLDPLSAQQARDYYDAIEWAGTQPWSSGKVGLLGISYYGMSQWAVAALKPPHLAAMIPWEAASDTYREFLRHGGILNADFIRMWSGNAALTQHSGTTSRPLSQQEKDRLRTDIYNKTKAHPLNDESYREWLPNLADIEVPFVSVGNWGNHILHLRGNTEAFTQAGSQHKWLRLITGDHFTPFYAPEALAMQEAFFGYYLKGQDTGWEDQPPVRVAIRHPDGIRWRDDTTWPLTDTHYIDMHLDADTMTLSPRPAQLHGNADFGAPHGTITFTYIAQHPIEITGPITLHISASATCPDMDLYVVLRQTRPDGTEHLGVDAAGTPTPVLAQGWLRASHRATDPARSLSYRPWHSHDTEQLLDSDEIVELDIEIWPTSIVLGPEDNLVLDISAHDHDTFPFRMDTDPDDRPSDRFDGVYTLYTGLGRPAYLRLPVIHPSRDAGDARYDGHLTETDAG
jgi:predicted acyl esterase